MAKLIFNGNLLDADSALFTAWNRAFCYGDALFETIRIQEGQLVFITDHLARLRKGMEYLHLKLPGEPDENMLSEICSRLVSENNITEAGRLRLEVFRNDGGFYISSLTDASFVACAEPLPHRKFVLNDKGLAVDIYPEVLRTKDRLSNLKTSNKLPFVLAGFYMKEKGLDECIMLNTDGNLAEAINSNLFLVKKDVLYTPSAGEGCIEGVMRQNIIRIASGFGKKVHEGVLRQEDLPEADEVFLTNTISGIRWVGAYRNKRYFNTFSRWLIEQLNRKIGVPA
jgi:branched-subunit amino acid aminotransferase/4-amino-4-deoxychorismate lyase